MKQLVLSDYHTESIHIYNIKEFNIVNDGGEIEILIIKHKEKL